MCQSKSFFALATKECPEFSKENKVVWDRDAPRLTIQGCNAILNIFVVLSKINPEEVPQVEA